MAPALLATRGGKQHESIHPRLVTSRGDHPCRRRGTSYALRGFVTRFITGQEDLPKQFCPMMDGMTWFENTRNRQPTPISTRFRPNFERLLHSANY
jgi:hypothetical protein